MKIVLFIILILLIIITALSFIPEDEKEIMQNNTQLKTVNGNEKFYEKIGAISQTNNDKPNLSEINKADNNNSIQNNSFDIKKEEENKDISIIEIIDKNEKELNEPKTNIIPENQLILEINNWKLIGQQKNILVVSFIIKNGFTNPIKNEKKLITCETFNSKKEKLMEVKSILEINIKAREELSLNDITIGYVDIETDSINCNVSNAPEEKVLDTSIKPLKDLKKYKNEYSEKSTNIQKGGFIYENQSQKEDNTDFVLPKLD